MADFLPTIYNNTQVCYIEYKSITTFEKSSPAQAKIFHFLLATSRKNTTLSLCVASPLFAIPPPFLKKILNPPLLRFLKIAYPVFGRGNSDCGREGLAAIRKNVL